MSKFGLNELLITTNKDMTIDEVQEFLGFVPNFLHDAPSDVNLAEYATESNKGHHFINKNIDSKLIFENANDKFPKYKYLSDPLLDCVLKIENSKSVMYFFPCEITVTPNKLDNGEIDLSYLPFIRFD